eukprot:TRINITY_DN392_c0_g1_i5.p1 TRINITY_DN392_c0_g1~~TRINITY_DN392_c0_g1_i5.p1  ORF type:complete len:161 (-),score=29.12 TRINITY_DN392_c0_g1_i5:17-499(-)
MGFCQLLLVLSNDNQSNCLVKYSTPSTSCIPRKRAPFFHAKAVLDGKFIDVSLDQFKGKYLALIFYPFDFTYVCPTELIAYSDALDKFKAIGAEVIAMNTESIYTHLAWTKTARNEGGVQGLRIPLLSDFGKNIAKSYGCLLYTSPSPRDRQKSRMPSSA